MNYSVFTSLTLKTIGIVFILTSLLHYTILFVPLSLDIQWQNTLIDSIVDRGILPLAGIGFIVTSYFIEDLIDKPATKKSIFNLELLIYILASILGLIFLLIIPVHLNNQNTIKVEALERIEEGAVQGAEQINQFLIQVDTLSKNPDRLNDQIVSLNSILEIRQLEGKPLEAQQLETLRQQYQQLKGLRELAKNPEEYKERTSELKKQLETQLEQNRKKAESQAVNQSIKKGFNVGFKSLMLAIAYSMIGWIGLKSTINNFKKS
ncbi:MAG: HpsJ family protein [Candidatus Atelocyanobacterium thalassa]|uniref:Uncharacterized protein n=1 Tax=Candidatus Atelocyanobacterium thalassa isolate SIO64986 TaxID=1527444 RepID=A0A086CI65_9CHRO|nr:MAG: hypothetical protein ucyna2_00258 [Candidatus Atelocyanobacterium thalassa isolate SIO64986]